jgi:nitroreductase
VLLKKTIFVKIKKTKMSQIIQALNWRYATKKFDSTKKVSIAKLAVLKEAFRLTATSFGLQPLKLIVVSNSEIKESLVEASFNQRQVADASHLLIIAIEKDYAATIIDKHFELEMAVRGTDEAILAPFKKYLKGSFDAKNEDELKRFALNQAYIVLGNLMTVCALEEIDACPMEGFVPSKYDKILSLSAQNLEAVLLLPIGYRAVDDESARRKKVRKTQEELILEL